MVGRRWSLVVQAEYGPAAAGFALGGGRDEVAVADTNRDRLNEVEGEVPDSMGLKVDVSQPGPVTGGCCSTVRETLRLPVRAMSQRWDRRAQRSPALGAATVRVGSSWA